jgi:uracil-DNA glycosylase
MSIVKIEESWGEVLKNEFQKNYFKQLTESIKQEMKSGIKIYPEGKNIFNAFNNTPFYKTKVVILGQDPYHNPLQANGLSFSVGKNVALPPSLKNIYKELSTDLEIDIPQHGDLSSWAMQGVLLLNSVLTVRENEPASHSKIGWQNFTDEVIRSLSYNREKIIFILWGNYAKQKKVLIDTHKHYVLEAAHPSPFSVYNGFFGCKHFSKTNTILKQNNFDIINWNSINEFY